MNENKELLEMRLEDAMLTFISSFKSQGTTFNAPHEGRIVVDVDEMNIALRILGDYIKCVYKFAEENTDEDYTEEKKFITRMNDHLKKLGLRPLTKDDEWRKYDKVYGK